MLRTIAAALAALWTLALAPVHAQDKKLSVRAEFAPATAAPGDEVALRVVLKIDEGWHVYGRDEETGEPPRLEVADRAGLEPVGETRVPVGVAHETFGIKSYWVTGEAVLEQRMRVPAGASGELRLRGLVHYMVCDEEVCLPPGSEAFVAVLRVAAAPQQPAEPAIDEPSPDRKVTFAARFEPATVAPGGEAELVVALRILDGWHVYGSRETIGTPATVRLGDGAPVRAVGSARIPAGEYHETFGQVSYWVTGTAELRLRVAVPPGAAPGATAVPFVIDYMACDHEMCDPPGQLDGTAALTVAAGPAAGAVPGLQDPLGLGGARAEPRFEARLEPEVARPGEVVDVVVSVTVPDGWHVYGAKDENPIRLVATAAEGFEPRGGNRLPDGVRHETGPIVNHWLGGGFELRQGYAVPADAQPGDRELGFRVDYLLCDEDSCLPPGRHAIELALGIEAGPVRPEYAAAATAAAAGGGWLELILGAIAAGLFALLMPCTYPMIPITISVFTKQADARGGKVLPVSLVYGAGIVSIFILIGIVVGPAIVPFATHWLTNAVIAAVFVLFAFSLFGWITLEPPRFLMNLAGRAQTHSGYVGVLLMGAALVITSFTCTVPFIGLLLATAAQGGFAQLVVGMGVFGLTMAIPFVALSLVPGKVRGIPRAGNWMNTLKVFLGFVEIAAALKFVSNVDLVIHDGPVWLSRTTFLWSWAAIMAAAALYLLRGFFVPSEHAGLKRAASAALSLAFAAWCAFGALGNDLDSVMTAIAPPKSTVEAGVRHEIVKDDYEQALARARATDRLVLINFTGFT